MKKQPKKFPNSKTHSYSDLGGFEPYKKPKPPRSCNRHSDCNKADEEAKKRGAWAASHCHDDTCEDCFGC